jgi:hypothetical protein
MTFEISLKGGEEEQLRWPVAVAAAGEDRIAIADAWGPTLFLFRRVGASWSVERTLELTGAPVSMTWELDRYVLSQRHSSDLLTLEGPELEKGSIALGQQVVPGPVAAVRSGGLWLYDTASAKVLRLDRAGRILASVSVDGTVTSLVDDGQGGFLATIGDQARVVRSDGKTGDLESWSLPAQGPVPAWPVGIALQPAGRVVVLDRHNGLLLVFDRKGHWLGLGSRQGWEPGLLRFPAGLARLPNDSLLVADQGNGRAQIFRWTAGRAGS